jgi:hypothetical protein
MPSIVAALKAYDRIHLIGEQVDNFALTLIAPLGANNDYIATHVIPFTCLFSPVSYLIYFRHAGAPFPQAGPR